MIFPSPGLISFPFPHSSKLQLFRHVLSPPPPTQPALNAPLSPTILTNQKTLESLRAEDDNYQFYLSLKREQILYLQCLGKRISGYEFPHGKAAVKWDCADTEPT
jgi:hypothetical protein